MYNLRQELEFYTPRRRHVVFNNTRGVQFNIVGKVPQQNQPCRRKNSSSPGYIGLLRDFALKQKENWMLDNRTVVLDPLVENVCESALVTLRGHLKKEGICEEALRLLDNVVILTEERKIGAIDKTNPNFFIYRTDLSKITLPWDLEACNIS